MSSAFRSAIRVLRGAEAARRDGCSNVCNFLPIPPPPTVKRILVGGGEALALQQFVNLLEGVSNTLAEHGIQRTIRDWPFENFWTDPDEPRHSRLLGYFINPRQDHNCGEFLLKHFLEVLKGAIKPPSLKGRQPPSFPASGCEVNVEADRIDLCIERTYDDEKFAIIVENKIHFAVDQPKQLGGYVQKVYQRGFDYPQIWVFYAPLTVEKSPDPDDRAALERLGVCYNRITFQTEVLAWLNNVLARSRQVDLPSDMDVGMRDNLRHYRDLISYLIEKHKEFHMKAQILQQLHQAEDAGTLPKFSELDSMKQSIASLQECLEQVYRAKLMREIHRILTSKGKKVSFCLEDEPAEEILINSDFDDRFDKNVDVCVGVDEGVRVCFGGGGTLGTWIGYMRQGPRERQKRLEAHVRSEAKEQLKQVRSDDPNWFGYDNMPIRYTDNCLTTLPQEIANKLLEMSNGLTVRLKSVK